MSDIKELFLQAGYSLDEESERRFSVYRSFLCEYNEKVNLTAICDDYGIVVKHFIDSAVGERYIPEGASVVDVGSGAGFPALPIKIIRPDLTFTLVDSLQKRIVFLAEAVEKMGLKNVECVHARCEDYAQSNREKYDVAVARAVAKLPTLAEYCLPLVRVGGYFIAYKTEASEADEAARAIALLGGQTERTEDLLLPDGSKRTLIVIKKVKNTPSKYPRLQNKPRICPL